jgi:hypothetical protein
MSTIHRSMDPVTSQLQTHISACIDDVADLMRSNRLLLNSTKTEILWSASSGYLNQLPRTTSCVGSDQVAPLVIVQDLVPCGANGIDLLICTAAAAIHPSFSAVTCTPVSGGVTRHSSSVAWTTVMPCSPAFLIICFDGPNL